MKKRWAFWIILLLLLALLGGGTWLFMTDVSKELWNSSIQTIRESTHQGVKAINIQLEADFSALERIWQNVSAFHTNQELLHLYWKKEPGVMLYPIGQKELYEGTRLDRTVSTALDGQTADRGILDTHKSSITGEDVFDLFLKITLKDGSTAFLVKEYHAGEVANQFIFPFYHNTGFSYLVDQDGTIMVRAGESSAAFQAFNVFDSIPAEENDSVQIEKLRENLRNQRSGWGTFCQDGTAMVFCYEPLQGASDWLMLSVIPKSVITRQANQILQKTMSLSGLAVGVILMFAATFFWLKLREKGIHTRELQEALEKADLANRAKGRFLMDMSHDIRTPLNAIIGMTTIAEEHVAEPDRIKDCLLKIKLSGSHLLSLVNDVLDMSQVEQGSVILQNEELSLPELMGEVIALLAPQAEEGGLTFEEVPPCLGHPYVEGDPLRIRQVFVNIVSNAIKYTPSGGQVILELTEGERNEEGKRRYRFCCTDTGIGMEPDFLERVFLPFERARNTTASRIAGTGVGLAITKKLLDLMGGRILVESKPGKGSVFTVELFLTSIEQEERAEEAQKIQKPGEAEALQGAKNPKAALQKTDSYSEKRVLLVEDNELNMEIMGALMEMIGVQVEKAYDGKEAVERLQTAPDGWFDLIFMDIQMPLMDGYEATRRIRRMEREDMKRIPIFAVSANALAEDVKNSLDAGMNGHISKPVDLDLLKKVMQECFDQT